MKKKTTVSPIPKKPNVQPWVEIGESNSWAATRAKRVKRAPVAGAPTTVPSKPRPKKADAEGGSAGERLHKFMAQCGIASRRKCEEYIVEGRVEVNGEIIRELGTKVTEADEVRVDGVVVQAERLLYVLMNKPKGVITTMDDEHGRRTVMGYLPELRSHVKPVGRLDQDTEGLLIFTNDGELSLRLTHPRYGVEKEYFARVAGQITEEKVDKLRKGVFIEGGRTAPARIDVESADERSSTMKMILHEGKKRQIRLMCESVGHQVLSLKRVRYAFLTVRGMREGESRMLGKAEVDRLRQMVGLDVL